MYVCTYVCICTKSHIHTHIHIYTNIHKNTHIYIYTHTQINTSNFACRNRKLFYFFTSIFDVFCGKANQVILIRWTHIGEVFS